MTEQEKQTMAVVQRHSEAAFSRDVDAIVADYAEDAVLIFNMAEKPVKGREEIRKHTIKALETVLKPEILANAKILKQEIVGEYAFLVFQSEPYMTMGADTYLIRDGKIIFEASVQNLKLD